ncbi:hypothetical protein BJ741DRAFT_153202 [Chytriomyces cf. hyalinus JEL632]|nr:hypothetical protein BJ741DRAFT_153202 [Chytriomyces cf. hyalinus JEL632]
MMQRQSFSTARHGGRVCLTRGARIRRSRRDGTRHSQSSPTRYCVNSSTPHHNVKFLTLSNTVFDASNYVRCTQTSIADRGIALRYDICSFSASAQPGLLDNIVGATFTWKLRVASNSTACQMNIFEMNLFGLPMSQVQPKNAGSGNGSTVATVNGPKGVSPGLIVGVSIAALFAAAVAALVFVRHRNLAKRKRAGRLLEAHLVAQ